MIFRLHMHKIYKIRRKIIKKGVYPVYTEIVVS